MKPLTIDDLLRLEEWDRVREVLRPLFIHEKNRRRLAVGPNVTLLFENAQTVWYQVEEMIRVERMRSTEMVMHEIHTYNNLLPGPGELSATLFVEFPDPAERDVALRELVGLEHHLWVTAGDLRFPATFEAAQIGADRVSAVQFVRFKLPGLSGEKLIELCASGRLAVEIDHPALLARGEIDPALARSLADDLRPAG